jgi:hypothetical protein
VLTHHHSPTSGTLLSSTSSISNQPQIPVLPEARVGQRDSSPDEKYDQLLDAIRTQTCSTTPPGAIVLVVSENEDQLMKLENRQAWHFLPGNDGGYAGHHPANGAAAITQLELLRSRGAAFLVLPQFASWWLHYYPEFREHLERRCSCIWAGEECRVYNLATPQSQGQKSALPAVFDQMIWLPDRMLLDGLVFRLEHFQNENWELGTSCFRFYKTRRLMEEFGRFFAMRPSFQPRNFFELGIWHGGSIAMWYEWLKPHKHVAVDLVDPRPSAYFDGYLASRQLQDRIKLYWRTNQADAPRLREIVANEFDAPLDLVIDDASHLYQPTKASFETLFPLLCAGGLYIIEDWAWSHWPGWQAADHQWAGQPALTKLVLELVEAVGTHASCVESISIYPGFVVVERGSSKNFAPNAFKVQNCILRRRQDRYDEQNN